MEYIVGRNHDAPVPIPQEASTVSGDHATIIVEGGKWTLVDNNSTNGTYIENDGCFERVARRAITPDTWIRLGREGVYGFTFKARRVVSPKSFIDDFVKLQGEWEYYKDMEKRLATLSAITPMLGMAASVICVLVTLLPPFNQSFAYMRAAMLLPGFISMLMGMKLNARKKEVAKKRKSIICPNCRRPISEYDINNGKCSICKAH